MNRGVWIKGLRETWGTTLAFALAVAAIEVVLAAVLPTFQADLERQLASMPFLKNFVRGLLGTDLGDSLTPAALLSFAWVHPVALSLVWAQEIVVCTRLPAGEVDRGTVDVLLGWPVSRRVLWCTETAVWLGGGAVVVLACLLGFRIGVGLAPDGWTPPLGRLLIAAANLGCLYVAVGGVALLISACSDRRGRAIAGAFAFVLASFFLQVLAQFWAPAKAVAFLGVLEWYWPLDILTAGTVPWGSMAVLVAVGAGAWTLGGAVFARRDIATV